MKAKKIIYGTANFGNNKYGIISDTKRSSPNEIINALNVCKIIDIDTSPKYGEAEKLIGKLLKNKKIHRKIDTKFVIDDKKDFNFERLEKAIFNSMKILNISKINILYPHNNNLEILGDHKLQEFLFTLKKRGLVKKIGATIYTPSEFEYILENSIYDVIQLPLNLCNYYLFRDLLNRNKHYNKLIYARSIFMRGILTNDNFFAKSKNFIFEIQQFKNKLKNIFYNQPYCLPEICLKFINSLSNIDGIIIGTHNSENLKNIKRWSSEILNDNVYEKLHSLSIDNKFKCVDPRDW